jgi:hypothetical protein
MDQGHRKSAPRDETRQGVYAAGPDGTYLGSRGFHPDPQRTLDMLTSALSKWSSTTKTVALPETSRGSDKRFAPAPPVGASILNVYTRIPIPQDADRWTPNNATGRDHLWILREELDSLKSAAWKTGESVPIPRNLQQRILRFHLVDNVRGEPNMWEARDAADSKLQLIVDDPRSRTLKLSGYARLKSPDGARGYDARVQGYLRCDSASGRPLDVRLLAWGEAWGSGTYTRGAPPGRFPLLVAFGVAGNSDADRVAPQAARWLPGYINPQ